VKIHVLLGSAVLLLVLSTGGASAGNYWNVSMIGSHGDTIWVQAEPSYEGITPCGGAQGDCMNGHGAVLNVSPCPLAVTCSGSEYIQEYYYDYNPRVVLALQGGVDYTFNGYAWAMMGRYMFMPDPPYMECWPMCNENFVFDAVVFSAPVGTQSQSWSGIKALFK
jgi:hypothetical protein